MVRVAAKQVIWVQPLVKSLNCYRPQQSWGKVIFSEACVKNSVHRGGLPHCMLEYTPQEQTPPRADTPGADPPLGVDTPREQTPSKCSACWGIWATSGWYAGMQSCYYPQMKFGQGNIINSMCQEFCSQGGGYLGRYPQVGTPPG